jgi:hypothetical protein
VRTTHLQGIAISPSGTYTADDLLAQVSLPDAARTSGTAKIFEEARS